MATALLMIHNTLYCAITQINVNSDKICIQFSLFMIDLNSTWCCQLTPGHYTEIWYCATCTYMYIGIKFLNVMLLALEALGISIQVLVMIYQFYFPLVLWHVDYQ